MGTAAFEPVDIVADEPQVTQRVQERRGRTGRIASGTATKKTAKIRCDQADELSGFALGERRKDGHEQNHASQGKGEESRRVCPMQKALHSVVARNPL